MNKDYYDFQTTPSDEDCVQVSSKVEYMPAMRAEAQRMLTLCRRIWPSLEWTIHSNPHDFGSYLSIRCTWDSYDSKQSSLFYEVEANWPKTWEEAEERAKV